MQAARALDAKRVDDVLNGLRRFTKGQLGAQWDVTVADGEAQPSLREQELEAQARNERLVKDIPVVKAALEAFPEAELAGFRLEEPRSE